ncbi:hypothetical protein D3C78_1187690 [compost metagenome]
MRVISGAFSGITTVARMPARAAYSDQAAPALPLVGMASASTPSSLALDTPTAAPRALNEPVGMMPSSFSHRSSIPSSRPMRGVRSRGVKPSPRLTTLAGSRTGSSS